jgi:hypothetical protein
MARNSPTPEARVIDGNFAEVTDAEVTDMEGSTIDLTYVPEFEQYPAAAT